MAWIDGGRLDAALVGSRTSLVLFPGGGTSGKLWKTIHQQMVEIDVQCDFAPLCSLTVYDFVIAHVSSAGVWHLQQGADGRVFPNTSRDPDSWQRLISVCSGMGGGILGLQESGFSCIAACDKSGLAVKTFLLFMETLEIWRSRFAYMNVRGQAHPGLRQDSHANHSVVWATCVDLPIHARARSSKY